MTQLFSFFTASTTPLYFPGAPMLMGALLTLLSLIFAMRALAHFTQPTPGTSV
jgi:DHA1 family tetracycline resistance protein-like MFS transporter